MEPALRKHMFKCREWEKFCSVRRTVVEDARICMRPNLVFHGSFIVRCTEVEVTAQATYLNYPPRVLYYIGGVRLTPNLFGAYFNDLLNAKEGWTP
jgi:hypothetical protein